MLKAPRLLICSLILVGCGAAQPAAPSTPPATSASAAALPAKPASSEVRAPAQTVVAAADRSEADRALDAGRKPTELLSFFNVSPGMRVLDLAAGGGYTTELLARSVGESGTVYGENPKFYLGFLETPWAERLQKPVMKHVVREDIELDAPWPAELKDLDLVTMVLFYHDSVWLETDRAKLNANVFAALKPGGVYGIVDHSAKAGDGLTAVKTLHRIEESIVKDEITKAGFVLDAEADFLREPSDTRDWSASPKVAGERRGHSDRFVLRFKKPG
jgi:predicted methyltransferase